MSIRWICTGYKRQSGCLLIVTVISIFAYTNYIGNGQVFRKVYRVMTPNQSLNIDQTGMIGKRFDRKRTSTKQYPLSNIKNDTISNLGGKPRQTVNSTNTIRYPQHSNRTNKMTPRKFNINKATNLFEHKMGNTLSLDDYFDDFDIHIDKSFKEIGFRQKDEKFKAEYDQMSEFWKSVADGIGVNRKIYQNDFDVDGLLLELQMSKIMNISFLFNRPTIKWILTLEGGQKALFKPKMSVQKIHPCNTGCEHPEYEIGGFTINRMLGLNTMPFTTGRTLDWFSEIETVASNEFSRKFIVDKRNISTSNVCVEWTCRHLRSADYCFPGGRIFGSIMYWVNGDIVELQQFSFTTQKYSRYHPMYFNKSFFMKAKLLGIGDTRLCDKVRLKPPYDDINSFLYILDMAVEDFLTQSINSKHNVLYLDSTNKTRLDVFIDKGKGFCPYENDLLLAPIYQCCTIRKSVYEALVNLEQRFSEVFQDMILLRRVVFTTSQLDGIESRVTVTLGYVKRCFELKGRHNVLMGN